MLTHWGRESFRGELLGSRPEVELMEPFLEGLRWVVTAAGEGAHAARQPWGVHAVAEPI